MNTQQKSEKKSVFQILTEQLTEQLIDENGKEKMPFWLSTPKLAINVKSGRLYTGINRLLLSPVVKKYQDNRFLTFKEISDMGGQVKKGEKGNIVYFASSEVKLSKPKCLQEQCQNCKYSSGKNFICQKEELQEWQANQAMQQTDLQELCTEYEQREVFIAKYYLVWNVRQTDLIEKGILPDEKMVDVKFYEESVQAILYGLAEKGLRIKVGNSAKYDYENNIVQLLGKPAFKNQNIYYASILKMLAFIVGASEKHLNLSYMKKDKEGNNAQENKLSYGNIVSEIATALISAELGVQYNIKRDFYYIVELIKMLREDSRFLVMACNSANRIAQYLLKIGQEYQQKNQKNNQATLLKVA